MKLLSLFLLLFFISPAALSAASVPITEGPVKAEVVTITSSGERTLPATRMTTTFQMMSVRILEGALQGEVREVENTTSVTFSPGDRLYLHFSTLEDGSVLVAVGEPDRLDVLLALTLLFVVVTVLAGGRAGVTSLISLVGSLLIIVFGLVPALIAGSPPVPTAVVFSLSMLVFSMVVTHGPNRLTWISLVGSVVALVLAAIVAETAVVFAQLTGFVSDEVVFLNLATSGTLDLSGLLLGGILIGVVGVLNDISVSQVHTVSEIYRANPDVSSKELLARSMRVGREHLGAVINTLPLAYAGAALPLLMLFASNDANLLLAINKEIFSVEIIRILSGGIALSLSGVIATVCAVYLVRTIPASGVSVIQSHHHIHK